MVEGRVRYPPLGRKINHVPSLHFSNIARLCAFPSAETEVDAWRVTKVIFAH